MHRETTKRPKLFHIDVIIPFNQDGTQSHYLCIYSARPCNKAVLHQFSAMCRFAVACRGDDRPSFSFLWPVWITWFKKKLSEGYSDRLGRIFSSLGFTAHMVWCNMLHVNCLTCPLHSINNSSLDINIVIPQGTKMSFFETKGECTWWEDGDMRKERLVRLLSYAVCMLTVLSLFPVPVRWTVLGGAWGEAVIAHVFLEGFPPYRERLSRD